MPKDPVKDQIEGPITINIGNVCEGALVDAFAIELDKCLKNIMDPNTSATAKREISMVITLKPKEDRVQLAAELNCSSKLAPLMPANARIFIGKDESGTLYALTEDPRQMNIFQPPKPIEAPAVIQFNGKK